MAGENEIGLKIVVEGAGAASAEVRKVSNELETTDKKLKMLASSGKAGAAPFNAVEEAAKRMADTTRQAAATVTTSVQQISAAGKNHPLFGVNAAPFGGQAMPMREGPFASFQTTSLPQQEDADPFRMNRVKAVGLMAGGIAARVVNEWNSAQGAVSLFYKEIERGQQTFQNAFNFAGLQELPGLINNAASNVSSLRTQMDALAAGAERGESTWQKLRQWWTGDASSSERMAALTAQSDQMQRNITQALEKQAELGTETVAIAQLRAQGLNEEADEAQRLLDLEIQIQRIKSSALQGVGTSGVQAELIAQAKARSELAKAANELAETEKKAAADARAAAEAEGYFEQEQERQKAQAERAAAEAAKEREQDMRAENQWRARLALAELKDRIAAEKDAADERVKIAKETAEKIAKAEAEAKAAQEAEFQQARQRLTESPAARAARLSQEKIDKSLDRAALQNMKMRAANQAINKPASALDAFNAETAAKKGNNIDLAGLPAGEAYGNVGGGAGAAASAMAGVTAALAAMGANAPAMAGAAQSASSAVTASMSAAASALSSIEGSVAGFASQLANMAARLEALEGAN
jgi:hypothetical protein